MAIVQTLSKASFIDAFTHSSRKDQFSYEALESIFEYMEEYSANTGESIELDIVSICCDYIEQDYKDIFNTYPLECESEDPSDDDIKQAVYDYLSNETAVIGETDSGFVYQQF